MDKLYRAIASDAVLLVLLILVLIYITSKSTNLKRYFSIGAALDEQAAITGAQGGLLAGQSGQTKNDSALRDDASTINQALNHGSFWANLFQDDDEQTVVDTLLTMGSTADILKVAKYYKEETGGQNLKSDLASELWESYDEKQVLNDHFKAKSIEFYIP